MNSTYQGRWLTVDLSSKTIDRKQIDPERIHTFLGGRGVGARELWDAVPHGADPLGEENVLIIAPGALTGTSVPCSGRTTLHAKSPATNHYLKTNVGGHLGIALKLSGTDGIVVTGCSSVPVYLLLSRGRVELHPAKSVWGLGVRDTTRALKAEHGPNVEVACIGPAGEKQVRYASVMTSVYSAAGRGGIGAVMGSKGLKAIVIDGSGGKLAPAHPDALTRLVKDARERAYCDSLALDLHRYGTASDIDSINAWKRLPWNNFQRSYMEGDISALSGRAWPELGYLKRIVGCGACIYSCHRFTQIDEGPYAGIFSGGPEYETVFAFGTGCGVTDPRLVFAANALCNDLGMDTISTGSVIQWAMECIQRGVLSAGDFDGLDIQFGNGAAVVELIRRIALREGFGTVLAEGVARASEQVGQGSQRWAMQVRGLEHSGIETRGAYAYALAFAVNPRGPDHLHTECLAEFGASPEGIALIERITGDAKYAVPDTEEKRPEIVRWHEDMYAISDALGICAFATTDAYGIDEFMAADLLWAATGIRKDANELMEDGRRIVTLERCFSIREGLCPTRDDRLPWRIMNETQPDLQPGNELSEDRLRRMLRGYYRLHGWDEQTGIPSHATLVNLGLAFARPEGGVTPD